jgi:hypothetical protein
MYRQSAELCIASFFCFALRHSFVLVALALLALIERWIATSTKQSTILVRISDSRSITEQHCVGMYTYVH